MNGEHNNRHKRKNLPVFINEHQNKRDSERDGQSSPGGQIKRVTVSQRINQRF